MVNRARNSRETRPLGRREPASGVAAVLFILDILGLVLAAIERLVNRFFPPNISSMLPDSTVGGLRLACLLAALLLLLLWVDLTSPRGLLESEKLKVWRIADWTLLCAAVLVGLGLSGVIYQSLTDFVLSPFLGF